MSSQISFRGQAVGYWQGASNEVLWGQSQIHSALRQLDQAYTWVGSQGCIGLAPGGSLASQGDLAALAPCPALPPARLGKAEFCLDHNVIYPYFAGSMANGISSARMVIALGKEKILSSFGAAGLLPQQIEEALDQIQPALPEGRFASNLIHSPNEPALEQEAVKLYLRRGVRLLEASAYLDLTPALVEYRVQGAYRDAQGQVQSLNKIIAKVSRKEVATRFMSPPAAKFIQVLLEQGRITRAQAQLAETLPMADDITAEADSGGHTDNRPMLALLPSILALRDELQQKYPSSQPIRVGAGGGIGSPEAALATFMLGADYIVTGSINQACLESGTSNHVRSLLAQADLADVMMAPSSDMFEMGVKLQVLKRGTLFGMRAAKLYELYTSHNSIDEIPQPERAKLESQIFQRPLEQVWNDCLTFFTQRDPATIEKAQSNPKRKMALIFRWYLGLSSRWANAHTAGREMDYQIWCGPAIGSFNDWVRGSRFAAPEARQVALIAHELMQSSAYLARLQTAKLQGFVLPPSFFNVKPQ